MPAMTTPRKRKPAKGTPPPRGARPPKAAAPPDNPWPARLKALRKKLGNISQADIAAKIRATRQSWITWEKGHARPSPQAQLLIELLESGKIS